MATAEKRTSPLSVAIAWIIVTILCIMKAVNGQRFIIPGLSQYADKF